MESGGWWMECQLEKLSRSSGKRSLQEGQKSSLVRQSVCHFDSHQVTGGNWRTRHLKMRSSYTRLAVMRVAGRTQGWRGYDYRYWNEGIGIPTED